MSKIDRLIASEVNQQGKLWLNVGSGPYPLDGFVNLDNHLYLSVAQLYPLLEKVLPERRKAWLKTFYDAIRTGTMVRYDCRRPLNFERPSAHHILCSHFLEHIYPKEAVAVVEGFYRALVPGGTLHLIVPDLAFLIDGYSRSENPADAADHFLRETLLGRPERPSWRYRALEAVGYEGLQHRWMYNRDSLERIVRSAGFTVLDSATTPSDQVRRGDPDSLHVFARKPE